MRAYWCSVIISVCDTNGCMDACPCCSGNLFNYQNKSHAATTVNGAALPVQGYFPTGAVSLPAGCRLRLLLLLAGSNPEKASRQASKLLEIGSGGKQVTHTSETNTAHCPPQLNIHRSRSQGIHTTADKRRRARDGGRGKEGWRKS